jgi:hypothetical protein
MALKEYSFNKAGYEEMATILAERQSIKIGKHLVIRQEGKGLIIVRLYFSDIIRYYEGDNSIQISNGGHMTYTTKKTLNTLLAGTCYIKQVSKKYDTSWYVEIGEDTYYFMNGMSIVNGLSDALRIERKEKKPVKPVYGVTLAMF